MVSRKGDKDPSAKLALMPPRVFRLNDKESGGCMAASRRWRRTQRRFGFNERINDAFTKRAKGEGREGEPNRKMEKRGRVSAACVNVG